MPRLPPRRVLFLETDRRLFFLYTYNISLSIFLPSSLYDCSRCRIMERKRDRWRERERPTARAIRFAGEITGKKTKGKTGRCIGGRGEKKRRGARANGISNILLFFFFFFSFASQPLLSPPRTRILIFRNSSRDGQTERAKRIGRRNGDREEGRRGAGRSALATHGRLRASEQRIFSICERALFVGFVRMHRAIRERLVC